MLNLLVVVALLAPAVALADPVSIAAAISFALSGTAYAVVGYTLFAAVTIYTSIEARKKARRKAAAQKAADNDSLQGRSITALTAAPPWRVVYGRCITGGDVVNVLHSDKTGTREDGSSYTKPDGYKHIVIEFAHHQCEDIHEIYIEGTAVGTLDGSGWATAGDFFITRTDTRWTTIPASSYVDIDDPVASILSAYYEVADSGPVDVTPTLSIGNTRITNPAGEQIHVDYTVTVSRAMVRWSKHLGTADQTVDTYLTGVCPTQWTANHRLRGATHIVVTLDLEDQRFQGGIPNITADVSGKLVLDPRDDTTAWSDNPALCIRDWLTSPWGYNCADGEVDEDYCIAAANACDVSISLDDGAGAYSGATYTCNGSFTTGEAKEKVLADLEESMAGFAAYGATWMIQAGAWTAPVTLPGGGGLGDDDLHGQIEIVQAGAGMDELFNGVRGSYIKSGSAIPVDIRPPYQNATFVTADGEELWTDVELPFTNSGARARNIARVLTEKVRAGLVIRYPAKLRAITLQVGDRVEVTSEEYGFEAKTFRVTDKQFSLTSPVILTLQEDIAEIYDQADAATADPTPNTALPDPWSVTAITGLTASSSASTMLKSGTGQIIPRVLVEWGAITDAYVIDSGRIEVRWRVGDAPWQQVNVPGDATSVYLVGPKHTDRLLVAARAVNGLGKVGPSAFYGHTVTGQTSIGSVQLAANYTQTGSSSSGARLTGGTGGTLSEARATLTYANSTGAAVTMEMEASLLNCGFSWDSITPSVAKVSYRYSSASLGTVTTLIYDAAASLPAGGDFGPLSATDEVSLPNGETLTFELLWQLTHTANAVIAPDANSFTRLTAIGVL